LAEPARNKRRFFGFVQVRPETGPGIEHLPEATEHYSRHHAQENQRNQDFEEREAGLFRIAYHRCVEALSHRMIKICRRVGWEAEKSARIRAVLRIHR
jgi:predicted TIM-barrel fold metal-dependent hydrolase